MFDHGGDIAVVSASADTGGRYLDRGAISETAAAAAAGAAAGAATAAAERAQSSPCYRPQRVPGARALGPFLQAMTASRQMKVSHEVCRVMTASVKEYLRQIMEACLVSARDGKRGQKAAAAATMVDARGPFPHKHAKYKSGGASSPSSTNFAATGAAGTAGMTSASSSSAAAPSPGTRPPLPEGQWVVTPGHLRAALEVSPRLAGPQSLARAHWRRVAMSAGDHPVVAVRGVSAAQGRAL
eukprot:jgi/Undpi1/13158/HiC_scaffold_8.g02820.m1